MRYLLQMFFGKPEDEARRLEAEAQDLLKQGNWPGALALGVRLLELGWSGGFEIRALAQQGMGAGKEALAGLEEAVQNVPGVWTLWLLLGNLRSDAGALEEAEEAFANALSCEGVSEPTVRFNRAVTRQRRGDPGEALADLEVVLSLPRPPAFAEDALGLTLECLVALGRQEEALALSASTLTTCEATDPRRPRLLGLRALILDLTKSAPAEVQEAYQAACDAGDADGALLALGRRLFPVVGTDAKRYRLIVQGRSDRVADAEGFFRIFDVVAAGPEQALEISQPYLYPEARDSAKVHLAEVIEEHSELECGCHGASAFMHFGAD